MKEKSKRKALELELADLKAVNAGLCQDMDTLTEEHCEDASKVETLEKCVTELDGIASSLDTSYQNLREVLKIMGDNL